jgi:peptidoglycan/LPS O-acetylase OafA/YrhL
VGWVPVLIILLAISRRGKMKYWLCPAHERRRRRVQIGAAVWAVACASCLIAAFIARAFAPRSWEDTFAFFAFVAGLLLVLGTWAIAGLRTPFRVERVRKDGIAKFRGAGWLFLGSLPSVDLRD